MTDKENLGKHDNAALYTRPLAELSNHELFDLMMLGIRLLPDLEEVSKRIQSSPEFLCEMFDFADGLNDQSRKKFSGWFSSANVGLANINATIISQISESPSFGNKACIFLPVDIRKIIANSDENKKREYLISFLENIDHPEIVFSGFKAGLFNPVVMTLQNITAIKNNSDIIDSLAGYLQRHAHKESGKENRFSRNSELGDAFSKLIIDFTKYIGEDYISKASGIISVFEKDVIQPYQEARTSIESVLSNHQFSGEFANKMIAKIVSDQGLTIQDVVDKVADVRSLDMLSTIFNRNELLKLTSRSVRGQALCDDLGM